MNYYWDEVVEVSKTLAWFVKKHDRDGLELCTTVPDVEGVNRHSGITTSTEFGNIAGSLRRDRASDITDILGEILDDYGKKLMQEYRKRDRARYPGSFRPIKPMTIYIFTDAVWTLESDPENAILKIVDILHKNSQYGSQQLGIQFIQWGPRVSRFTERLERLDKLKSYRPDLFHQSVEAFSSFCRNTSLTYGLREFRDIVDHTHVEDDNIWKMLFGSINKEFDDD